MSMWLFLCASFAALFPVSVIGFAPLQGLHPKLFQLPDLRVLLSKNANIAQNRSSDFRWSNFHAPAPGVIVNVATEDDVLATVTTPSLAKADPLLTLVQIKYCNANNISFLAQNGGSGWISSFERGPSGVIINMRGLNTVSFNCARTHATIGGGTLISETIEAAMLAMHSLPTGNCSCVGDSWSNPWRRLWESHGFERIRCRYPHLSKLC